jgi:inhibitor of cysteine peptidase
MDPINLTEADDGTRIAPAPGQAVVIRLPENPTTGFRWQPPADAAIEGDEFIAAAGGAAGAAGVRVITLAAGRAPTTLRFGLSRSWETEAAETFTVHLD